MKVIIRLASEADAEQDRAIYAPFCAADSPVSFEIVPPSLAEIRGRMTRTLAQNPWLVCERGDEIFGYADAGPHAERAASRWSVTTAISIQAGCRGRGVGRGLCATLLAVFREQGYASAFAGTTLPNDASNGLHRALGFEPVGEYRDVGYAGGRWLDTAWCQVSLGGRKVDPPAPRAITAIHRTAAWDEAVAAGEPLVRLDG